MTGRETQMTYKACRFWKMGGQESPHQSVTVQEKLEGSHNANIMDKPHGM